ncbi:hypothetical protein AA106555_0494 [Neokomagataea thailandica NBRC 106555]|uniref:Uncharacterized protein n=2 Tax=Neokomagataea TaxID=1223423 RepID=A0A4Y6V861_9PROT|nr:MULTISPECIES: hypothetical protein [Neokomagataea]QDH24545.1 hypothetical protein D5366_04035 [Neokomagataea tanensis]GBR51288.1 hypothetical protein AA106555_0494 [Neokomagataea thailandica NBRC 106555]
MIWQDKNGAALTCLEKVRVLRENDAELRQILQDAFEDGILMGASADSMLRSFEAALETLKDPTAEVCSSRRLGGEEL